MVTVRVEDTEPVPADVKITTDSGARSFLGVEPGKSAYQSSATRRSAVTPGAVTVELSGRIDQLAVRTTVTALYDARG